MWTTLNEISEHYPGTEGGIILLRHLGKTHPDDEPLSIATVLEANGLDDALWALRAVKGYDKEIRLYAVWCARQVQHLMTDRRSVEALDVAERFANGEASEDELSAAAKAAWSAGYAARAAANAAMAAANAAWSAANAAMAAANAAWSAGYAARAAAGEAARAAQEQKLREICEVCQ